MTTRILLAATAALTTLALAACQVSSTNEASGAESASAAKLAEVTMSPDTSYLTAEEREVVNLLILAAVSLRRRDVAAATMVVVARNPVHSVLYLILAFFNAAALFLLMGAEFLAMILVVVYVGAVAVLFLFVVMMLDVNLAALREGFLRYLPIGGLIGLVLFVELIFIVGAWIVAPEAGAALLSKTPAPDQVDNTRALGQLVYTRYIYLFQGAGLVLLVAMIGALLVGKRPVNEEQE